MMCQHAGTVYETSGRYTEEQAAMYSALTEKTFKNKEQITHLSEQEVSTAECAVEIMKPLKMITTILSTETTPSVSMILPLKTTIMKAIDQKDNDIHTAREIKQVNRENL